MRTVVLRLLQNVLRDKGSLPRLARLLELQRMALWMRHANASSSISVTINAVTNMAINPDNGKQLEVSDGFIYLL